VETYEYFVNYYIKTQGVYLDIPALDTYLMTQGITIKHEDKVQQKKAQTIISQTHGNQTTKEQKSIVNANEELRRSKYIQDELKMDTVLDNMFKPHKL
jgi:hypothetical protein